MNEKDPSQRNQSAGNAAPSAPAPAQPATGRAASSPQGQADKPSLLPALSIPKGGGAIRGIGEKFSVNAATGTAGVSVPIATSPGRGGFGPQLELGYDSGSGNGPFGLGFHLSAPAITRKTDKGLPKYSDWQDSDVYILAGAEDLVPVTGSDSTDATGRFALRRYQPRVEGAFARIVRWTSLDTGEIHWRVTTKDNVTHIYGLAPMARIADPGSDETKKKRIFSWLLNESRDDRGNVITYEYVAEDGANVDASAVRERTRFAREGGAWRCLATAQRYLKYIHYGNRSPNQASDFLFHVAFDYGDHGTDALQPSRSWKSRLDAFSNYRPGFEVRTYRLCDRVLMFHHFGSTAKLVSATELAYDKSPVVTYLVGATHWGYADDGSRAQLPTLQFDYTRANLHDQVQFLSSESSVGLVGGIDGQQRQWVDLDGEGIPGVLIDSGDGWHYKANLGNGVLAPPRPVTSMPVPHDLTAQHLEDLAGDGTLDLVQLGGSLPGYFTRTSEGAFAPMHTFASLPSIDWQDPNLRFVDLDGDGLADVLITETDCYRWYRSLGKDGYAEGGRVPRSTDEDRGPSVVFSDGTQSILLADMSGDGLVDIVRVRNGQVCYWPNLGHGRFGAMVILENSPRFDYADQFDPKRVRLGDVDGSGTSDIFYLGRDGIRVYLNQSGNRLADGQLIASLPPVTGLAQVSVVDLLGTGTSCLVWSSQAPSPEASRIRYVGLMGGVKPHLMKSEVNNLGAETEITYAPSTKFYLADKAAGTPWLTRLAFPVHVVERTKHLDAISNSQMVSRHAYHHGFFDGVEREFRGFARVEQWDTEDFSQSDPATVLHQPPVRTVSWFHTGAWMDKQRLEEALKDEYFQQGPDRLLLPDTQLEAGLSVGDQREACRALRGHTLRQEVYAEDGDALATAPYVVTESAYRVVKLQSAEGGRHGVFFAYPSETVTLHSERHATDPRIGHELILEVDEFGNVKRKANIAYGRLGNSVPAEQQKPWATLTETDFINRPNEPTWYRLGVESGQRLWELTGFVAPGATTLVKAADLLSGLQAAAKLPYDGTPGSGFSQRLLDQKQQTFYKNDLSGPLALGQIESLALPYETYQLALTPGLVTDIVNRSQGLSGTAFDLALLASEGRYVQRAPEPGYWTPSGRAVFDSAHFFLPVQAIDPFGKSHFVAYDEFWLLPTSTTDPLGNIVSVLNDYRVLVPKQITDPNLNRTAIGFDALGMVVWTAIMGKAGAGEGDTETDPTTTFEYHLNTWQGATPKPTHVKARAREKHQDASTPWQESYTYSDGFGRVVMQKVQAEPDPATPTTKRWVGTGRTVFNNKGKPVKQYEPFFSATSDYEEETSIVESGVTPIIHYDPLGRVIRTELPNGTESRVVFDAWGQETWDPNDSVEGTPWLAQRQLPGASTEDKRAATLTLAHAGTPTKVHLDALGRTFLSVAWNKIGGGDDLQETRTELDIEGNTLSVTDARSIRCAEQKFDVLGRAYWSRSTDAGIRLTVADVAGKPLRTWDNRGQTGRSEFDDLQRPVKVYVKTGSVEKVVTRTVYGEALDPTPPIPGSTSPTPAQTLNLRGQAFLVFDSAGLLKDNGHDFKGNLLSSSRRLAVTFTSTPEWSTLPDGTPAAIENAAAALLEAESFTVITTYDALNRVVERTTPDGKVTVPTYNEANLLNTVSVISGGTTTPVITNIDYDAKGQRVLCQHPGHKIEYAYDPKTFRLARLWTSRASDGQLLQDLRYTYDPVGNIVELQDRAAWQPFFTVQPNVNGDGKYEYDAVYRLTRAEGREHPGQQPTEADPELGRALPHANDLQTLFRYSETYAYDKVGNIQSVAHALIGNNPPVANWTRTYKYATDSNRLLATNRPDGSFPPDMTYTPHGSMTSMPHLSTIDWDYADRMQHADLGGGGHAYFTYDAAGQRVRKVWEHGQTDERIYLGGYEIYRQRSGTAVTLERQTLHVMDDQRRVALVETNTTPGSPPGDPVWRFQLDNHLGSSAVEVDLNAAVISYEEYHPYGTSALRISSGNAEVSAKRYRYTGKERDEETSLYYHGARYYAPWLGRWTATDPAGMVDGTNIYVFSKDCPVVLSDPSGMDPPDPRQFTTREQFFSATPGPYTDEYLTGLWDQAHPTPASGVSSHASKPEWKVGPRGERIPTSAWKGGPLRPISAYDKPIAVAQAEAGNYEAAELAQNYMCPTCHALTKVNPSEFSIRGYANAWQEGYIKAFLEVPLQATPVGAAWEIGVSGGQAVTGESSGLHISNISSAIVEGQTDRGRKLSTKERIVEGASAALGAVTLGIAASAPRPSAFASGSTGVPFDPAKLARIQANLEKQGVSFVTGEEGGRFARALGGEAIYMPAEVGQPGIIAWGPNPSRAAVVEELLHLGQHRATGWADVSGRIVGFELQAQDRLLVIGARLGWTESELSQIARARISWASGNK